MSERIPADLANVPPNNLLAEEAVLGACLSRSDSLNHSLSVLRAEDFYYRSHQMIFECIASIVETHAGPVDVITVFEELDKRHWIDQVGGMKTLNDLVSNASLLYNDSHYVDLVKEKSKLRQLIKTFRELSAHCFGEDAASRSIMDLTAERIIHMRKEEEDKGFRKLGNVIMNRLIEIQKMAGENESPMIRSGYSDLDRKLGGLRKGSLLILAARPGMGKSAFAFNIVQNVSMRGEPVPAAIFSLEMSKEEVSTRLMSSQLLLNSAKLNNGTLSEKDWQVIMDHISVLYEAPVYIDDRSNMNPIEMLSVCRELKLKVPELGLVIVDYLQLMGGSGGRRSENRQQEISEISRNLKIMARELDLPVIALSQLSRACELRNDKRPMLSDLRESGAIEQDADVVMFLYRDDYYQRNQDGAENPAPDPSDTLRAELIVAKNRHGETGTIELGWTPQYTRFTGYDRFRNEEASNLPF